MKFLTSSGTRGRPYDIEPDDIKTWPKFISVTPGESPGVTAAVTIFTAPLQSVCSAQHGPHTGGADIFIDADAPDRPAIGTGAFDIGSSARV